MTAAAGDALSQVLLRRPLEAFEERINCRRPWTDSFRRSLHASHDGMAGTASCWGNSISAITCGKLITPSDNFVRQYFRVFIKLKIHNP
ncbi:MAG: hypothetical protein Q7U92_03205 [Bradyrhizobium sp.]|nr:hypothetical protein [Bradyrhizobium sp.]